MITPLTDLMVGSRMYNLVMGYNERRIAIGLKPRLYSGIQWTDVDTLAESGVSRGARVTHVNFWTPIQQFAGFPNRNPVNGFPIPFGFRYIDALPVVGGGIGQVIGNGGISPYWPNEVSREEAHTRFYGDDPLSTDTGVIQRYDVLGEWIISELEEKLSRLKYVVPIRGDRNEGMIGLSFDSFSGSCSETRELMVNNWDKRPLEGGAFHTYNYVRFGSGQQVYVAAALFPEGGGWNGYQEYRGYPSIKITGWPIDFPIKQRMAVGETFVEDKPWLAPMEYYDLWLGSGFPNTVVALPTVGGDMVTEDVTIDLISLDFMPLEGFPVNCGNPNGRQFGLRNFAYVVEPDFEFLVP
jgi:hypothetical protein